MTNGRVPRSPRKYRVLLVVRWPVGGIRTFLKYVLAKFPPDKYDFLFVGADTESTQVLRDDLGELVSEWFLFPNSGSELKACMRLVWQAIESNDIDVIHAHGFTSALASVIPAKVRGVPTICTSHDMLTANQFLGIKGVIKKIGLSVALNQCVLIHSVSEDAKANLSAMLPLVRKNKLTVVLSGVDTTAFRDSTPRDLKTELSLADDAVLIGFFGRFMSLKGFGFLVDAIDRLREDLGSPQIHVVCFGSGAFIREEQADIERRKLTESFTFFPFTADISGAMKGCDLIAMPSKSEACGLLAMEALSAGVPLVGSDCIGLREVLKDTPAVVVKTGDSDSLAAGIVKCLEKGRPPFEDYVPIAVERFNVINTANKIQTIYEQVLR